MYNRKTAKHVFMPLALAGAIAAASSPALAEIVLYDLNSTHKCNAYPCVYFVC